MKFRKPGLPSVLVPSFHLGVCQVEFSCEFHAVLYAEVFLPFETLLQCLQLVVCERGSRFPLLLKLQVAHPRSAARRRIRRSFWTVTASWNSRNSMINFMLNHGTRVHRGEHRSVRESSRTEAEAEDGGKLLREKKIEITKGNPVQNLLIAEISIRSVNANCGSVERLLCRWRSGSDAIQYGRSFNNAIDDCVASDSFAHKMHLLSFIDSIPEGSANKFGFWKLLRSDRSRFDSGTSEPGISFPFQDVHTYRGRENS